tara:strand:- start:706 stop:1083 length:378 start_codon:yes stop_codon:yes gene_type:complete
VQKESGAGLVTGRQTAGQRHQPLFIEGGFHFTNTVENRAPSKGLGHTSYQHFTGGIPGYVAVPRQRRARAEQVNVALAPICASYVAHMIEQGMLLESVVLGGRALKGKPANGCGHLANILGCGLV